MNSDEDPAVVLVGIDNSEPSRAALAWAAHYARASGAQLVALYVRDVRQGQLLSGQAWSAGAAYLDATDLPDPTKALELMFAGIDAEPDWRLETADGPAGLVLVRASEAADVLVVGTHEHTGLDRLVTGSVSHYCLTHATKPVVAVPPQLVFQTTETETDS